MTAPDRPPGPEGDPIAETIARVRELDAAATKGPWVGGPDGGPHRGRVEERSARGIETVAYTYCGAYDGHGARNAELVAEYRTACPQLAAECERLRERVARLEDALRPLAEAADHVESTGMGRKLTDETGLWLPQSNVRVVRGITLGDARTARAALKGSP